MQTFFYTNTINRKRMLPANTVLFVTAITTALIAGFFYAWSCSVIPGLKRVDNNTYLSVMQNINRAIQNPVFFACFLGTVVLLPLCTYLHYPFSSPWRFRLLLAASVVYLAGVLGVTVLGNIPLNEALNRFPLSSASPGEMTAQRLKFELPWNSLNTIRTLAALLCFVLVLLACMRQPAE